MAHLGAPRLDRVELPAQEQTQQQVQRILQSAAFRNASMLQQLLQFLVAKAYARDSEPLKEYTIGVEAFGRPYDFDPKTDTIVRVQIHRLRQKLKEYYDADGRLDTILIEIPKGHYLPNVETVADPGSEFDHDRPDPGTSAPVGSLGVVAKTDPPDPPAVQENGRNSRIFTRRRVAAGALVVAIFLVGFWFGRRPVRLGSSRELGTANTQPSSNRSADPVKAFWTTFLGNDSSPVVAYPDAVFLLDDSNDLFRFRRGASDDRGAPVDPHLAQQFASNPFLVARAGKLFYENAYLGAGELKAVALLSNLFGQMGLKPIVKPSREITPDDLRQHNVILLGSSFQNFAVAHLDTMGDFSFKNPDNRLEQWRGMIVNSRPRASEASTYRTERDPNTQVLETDYSLITIQPGVVPGRYIANLGGLDTTGTEGAVVFATSRQGIEDLNRMSASIGNRGTNLTPPLFQALLGVRLEKGYEVLGVSLLSVHELPTLRKSVPDNTISDASRTH